MGNEFQEAQLIELAARLSESLRRQGVRMATAESCTGGWIARILTALAGSSEWFECSFVTYSNEAKCRMLGVREQTLTRCGAVSEAVVREMVAGAVAGSRAELAVAVSGIAGPGGGSAAKPVGTVWFAWGDAKRIETCCECFSGDREQVRYQAVARALHGLLAFAEQREAGS